MVGFSKGDKVLVLNDVGDIKVGGMIGVVVNNCAERVYSVEFPSLLYGKDDRIASHSCQGEVQDERGLWVVEGNLKLLSDFEYKDGNPKDSVGTKKAPMSCVPSGPLMEMAVGMQEGARKYGRHNYRAYGIRASVYYDATMRHLMAWWEGEDQDPDSGMSHITKAMTSLCVLRDAQINDMWTDDRPPESHYGWLKDCNAKASEVVDKYPDPKPPHTKEVTYGDAKDRV